MVHTCPNYNNNFVDESFKFPSKPKTFKPPLIHDTKKWHDYKPKRLKSRVNDPLDMINQKRLNKLQENMKRKGLTKT